MPGLQALHEASVTEEHIDELGHMNVRFYLEKALRATEVLADRVGLGLGPALELRGVYTRHYREQMLGAELLVRGGVLDVRGAGLRFYHELANPARDELAATFVHDLTHLDERRTPRPLPEGVAERAARERVDWPEHGRPRTLDLDSAPTHVTLDTARERGIANRRERVLAPEECRPDGLFPPERYQDLVWGGESLEERESESWLLDTEDGGKFGWATLESRGLLLELPRAGTRIQSFGCEVAVAAKTSFRHHWVFDLDREKLLCISSIVNLAFHVGRREAIEIPAAARQWIEARHHPDLR